MSYNDWKEGHSNGSKGAALGGQKPGESNAAYGERATGHKHAQDQNKK